MKDAKGEIIYVGKAGNLKKRLATYFARTKQPDMKTGVMIRKVHAFETILTGTEKEALILEANLIKQHKPRYNVILKDDKRYPSLRLDIKSPYPNLTFIRRVKKDGAMYFGPFTSTHAVRQALKTIHKTFKLRRCKTTGFKNRSRPCLNHQMGACLAPCCLDVPKNQYDEIVREVILFLNGRTPELIRKIENEMTAAAEVQNFERAADLRDKMFALEQTLEKQAVVIHDFKDRDVVAVAGSMEFSMITLLFIRGGFLLGTQNFGFSETFSSDAEVIGTFIRQYYEKTPFIPGEILAPVPKTEAALLGDWLEANRGRKLKILWPKRGEKARLLEIAARNAENGLKDYVASVAAGAEILVKLQKRLKMGKMPERIECFDNSSLSGKAAVSGMVVFERGKPNTSLYRKYRIRTAAARNDYACMYEVLKRRFSGGEKSLTFPDILMVDGGKGQLNIAVAVLKELKIDGKFEVLGIAKKDEKRGEARDKVYRPGQGNPVNLGRGEELLLFLEKIRDEAHRFTLSFHRKRRSTSFKRSALDSIPGVGKQRKRTLLGHFGSIRKIQAATLEELSVLPGISHKLADNIKKTLNT